jgi:hypothetical protein
MHRIKAKIKTSIHQEFFYKSIYFTHKKYLIKSIDSEFIENEISKF